MKILYLCTYFHEALLYRQQMDWLINQGHIVKVFNSTKYGTNIQEKFKNVFDDNVKHVECWNKFDRYLFFPRQFKIEKKLIATYDPHSFDIMHSHLMLSSGFTARRIKKKYGLPYVVSVRVTDLIGWIKIPFFHKMALKNIQESSGILFLSKSHRDEFIKKYVPAKMANTVLEKSIVVGNPLEKFWQSNTVNEALKINNSDTIKVLTVARINKVKNIEMAAKAVDELQKRGYKAVFTVVGLVEDEEVFDAIKRYSFINVLPFAGFEELKKIYNQNHIFLLPSLVETFGRVYVEAMSQGLPILYTRGQGFDGVYERGTVGYDVDPYSEVDICDNLELIIENYTRISENCLKCCKDFYEDRILEKIEQFYKESLVRSKQ